MIVECLGLPGSGKTSLLRALRAARDPSFRFVAVRTLPERLAWFALGWMLHPVVAVRFMACLVGQPPALRRYLFHLWTVSLAATAKAEACQAFCPRRILFLDEGILQRALSVCDAPAFPALEQALAPWLRSRACLLVEGGGFERFGTAHGASTHPRLQAGAAAFQRWEGAATATCQRFFACIRQTGRAIAVPNAGRPPWDALLPLVRRDLRRFMEPAGKP